MKSYIETNPKILNGKPVITGTRITLSRILYLLAHGYSFTDISREYPFLTPKTLQSVMNELGEKLERKEYGAQAVS